MRTDDQRRAGRTPSVSAGGTRGTVPLGERRLRAVDGLDLSPVELARRFAALGEDFVFLDSSMSDVPGAGERFAGGISIVAVRPARVLTGSLAEPAELDAALASQGIGASSMAGASSVDLGFPAGGLFGSIDYDGSYCFGEFCDLLVFDHASESWFEVGRVDVPAPVGGTGIGGSCAAGGDVSGVSIESEMGEREFVAMVRTAQDYIAAGDIYQVNLSRRFSGAWPEGARAFGLYEVLREVSPAPQAAYLQLGGRRVLSSSPELFLRMSGRAVLTRPIKGTRPRCTDPAADEKSAYDLITSAKEVSELVMITDLERNDLGQVCEFGSVRVGELLKIERFAQVFHLVSTVGGTLRPGVGHVELVRRCFPGGSITGAPKRRAMEIIAELEPVPRGLYTGAVGYFGFNGESQFSIAIRTAIVERGRLSFHSGAGIVADSVPGREFEETGHKAAGILRAIEAWKGMGGGRR